MSTTDREASHGADPQGGPRVPVVPVQVHRRSVGTLPAGAPRLRDPDLLLLPGPPPRAGPQVAGGRRHLQGDGVQFHVRRHLRHLAADGQVGRLRGEIEFVFATVEFRYIFFNKNFFFFLFSSSSLSRPRRVWPTSTTTPSAGGSLTWDSTTTSRGEK